MTYHFDKEAHEEGQRRKIYFLAREVWPMQDKYAPSGDHTWAEVFERHAGMTLEEYKKYAIENNLRKKYIGDSK